MAPQYPLPADPKRGVRDAMTTPALDVAQHLGLLADSHLPQHPAHRLPPTSATTARPPGGHTSPTTPAGDDGQMDQHLMMLLQMLLDHLQGGGGGQPTAPSGPQGIPPQLLQALASQGGQPQPQGLM